MADNEDRTRFAQGDTFGFKVTPPKPEAPKK